MTLGDFYVQPRVEELSSVSLAPGRVSGALTADLHRAVSSAPTLRSSVTPETDGALHLESVAPPIGGKSRMNAECTWNSRQLIVMRREPWESIMVYEVLCLASKSQQVNGLWVWDSRVSDSSRNFYITKKTTGNSFLPKLVRYLIAWTLTHCTSSYVLRLHSYNSVVIPKGHRESLKWEFLSCCFLNYYKPEILTNGQSQCALPKWRMSVNLLFTQFRLCFSPFREKGIKVHNLLVALVLNRQVTFLLSSCFLVLPSTRACNNTSYSV